MLTKGVEKQLLSVLREKRGVEGGAVWRYVLGWGKAGGEEWANPLQTRKLITDQQAAALIQVLSTSPKRIVPRARFDDESHSRTRGQRKQTMKTNESSVIENMKPGSTSAAVAPKKAGKKAAPAAPAKKAGKKAAAPAAPAKKAGKKAAPASSGPKISAADTPKKSGVVTLGDEFDSARQGSKIEKLVELVRANKKGVDYVELVKQGHAKKIMPRPRGVMKQLERAFSNRFLKFTASK